VDDSEITPRASASRTVRGGAWDNDPKLSSNGIELRCIGEEAITSSASDSDSGTEPTELEKKELRHVGESLPYAAWLVAFVELCERFTYYGCQGLFQVRGLMCIA
jgi:proton-dependent oligopeptide transporter, POT family